MLTKNETRATNKPVLTLEQTVLLSEICDTIRDDSVKPGWAINAKADSIRKMLIAEFAKSNRHFEKLSNYQCGAYDESIAATRYNKSGS